VCGRCGKLCVATEISCACPQFLQESDLLVAVDTLQRLSFLMADILIHIGREYLLVAISTHCSMIYCRISYLCMYEQEMLE
jgi:hypothetical protein